MNPSSSVRRPSVVWTPVMCVALFVAAAVSVAVAQQQTPGRGQAPPPQGRAGGPPPRPPLGDGPWLLDAGRQRIRVTVVTKALVNPWALAFLPDGNMLVTERPGRLRVVRNGVLDPQPLAGLPQIHGRGLGGMLDVILHPRFAENRLIYFAYSKPGERGATTAVARARFDGGATLTNVEDILVADAWHTGTGAADGSFGSRLAFDANGLLYITLGERNVADKAQDPNSHLGKILRLRDDGTVPPDNPFAGRPGYKPEIYSLGHRNPLGLAFHPETGALWSTEQGPQGGDEVNIILPGRNYGWPRVSYGRNYDGTPVGDGPVASGMEDPLVFWVPAIAISGLSFYSGDQFPTWKGSAFVGGLRNGTGQHVQRLVFNAKGLPTNRELMLTELRQRIRQVQPGPDGFLYVLTDEAEGAILRIEPAG